MNKWFAMVSQLIARFFSFYSQIPYDISNLVMDMEETKLLSYIIYLAWNNLLSLGTHYRQEHKIDTCKGYESSTQ